ncbi:MAG: hypothetical protein K2G24_05115, partial [Muribaculaceae bacterium]|nr:hypothetical protein [Muribaculaceae bacterium]
LRSEVNTSGQVSIDSEQLPAGHTANVVMNTVTTPLDARILAVTGIVDPVLDINPAVIQVNDIPDFLASEGNMLDVENPRISFKVYNGSPVGIRLNAVLSAIDRNGARRQVGIGDEYGTQPVEVAADRTTEIVVSRRPVAVSGAVNIVTDRLGELISAIPDCFEFGDIRAQALPDVVTMALGAQYSYECRYEAVIPLAFGADMRLNYSKDDTGWNEDLHKYNFSEVHVSADIVSTIPMILVPAVKALDGLGNELDDITAEIEGVVAAGTIGRPAVSPVKITLRSDASNLGNLDGVRIMFDGTTDASLIGVNLNRAQSLEFENIIIKIAGGLTVDLN